MVETRRNLINRGKQPVTTVPNNKDTPEYIIDTPKLKISITKLIRLVKTNNKDKDNTSKGSSSLYKRLTKTLLKERF